MTKNDMIKMGIVVGIVAGVILFGLQYLVQRGREVHRQMAWENAQSQEEAVRNAQMQIANLGTALDAFEIDVGRYPTTTEGLNALVVKPASHADRWAGPYLSGQRVPKDPWGMAYIYENDGNRFAVRSCGLSRST